MHRPLVLALSGLLFTTTSSADPAAGGFITDRPSADRPKLPDFAPKNAPSFSLPAVEKGILPKDKVNSVKIQLKGVEFVGNAVISTEQLQAIAQPFIGKPVVITDLEELRQRISHYYSDQGYVNSGAILPDQPFQNGIIRLHIVEGRLTEVRVKGTEWLDENYVSDRLQRDKNSPLNINMLREQFQQLLLDPLIERMNGNLVPGTQRGQSILDVEVTRARPYQLSLTFDNYRPPSIGSEEGKLSGWVRNATGFGDIIDGTLIYSQGTLGGSGGFSMPLNASNTRFNFHFDISRAAVIEKPLDQVDIKSEYSGFEFGLMQPLIQSLNRNLSIGMAFNVKENKTTLLGEPFSFSDGAQNGVTKDSVLRFSLDFTERLEHHVFSARSTTSVGIRAFNATWAADKSLPDGDFVAWLGQLQYAGQLFDNAGTLILHGDVQWADDKLLPLERFSLGGRYSVRGYRENEVVRDKGYVVSAEYRYPLLTNETGNSFPGQLTVFPFMDYGAGWNRGARNQIRYLHSVGIGLEWQPIKNISTEIMYAHDLNTSDKKTSYDLQDSGLHWQVTFLAF
jgi:hemolysin activation/secretion protein